MQARSGVLKILGSEKAEMMKSQVQFLVNLVLVGILIVMLVLAGASIVTAAPPE